VINPLCARRDDSLEVPLRVERVLHVCSDEYRADEGLKQMVAERGPAVLPNVPHKLEDPAADK